MIAVGTTHELSDAEILHKDSTDYLMNGNLTLTDGRIDKYLYKQYNLFKRIDSLDTIMFPKDVRPSIKYTFPVIEE